MNEVTDPREDWGVQSDLQTLRSLSPGNWLALASRITSPGSVPSPELWDSLKCQYRKCHFSHEVSAPCGLWLCLKLVSHLRQTTSSVSPRRGGLLVLSKAVGKSTGICLKGSKNQTEASHAKLARWVFHLRPCGWELLIWTVSTRASWVVRQRQSWISWVLSAKIYGKA